MQFGIKRKLDYSDYMAAPEDGQRYEILEGDLYVSPPPSPMHQRVSRRLQRQLEDYFHERSPCSKMKRALVIRTGRSSSSISAQSGARLKQRNRGQFRRTWHTVPHDGRI